MFELKIIEINNLNILDSNHFIKIRDTYLRHQKDLFDFDHANSRFAGRASIKLYIKYIQYLEKKVGIFIESNDESLQLQNQEDEVNYVGMNLIVYGTPGCGKSYYVENTVLKDYNKEKNVIRTTFFLDYSNADFVGTYRDRLGQQL